MKFVQSLVVRLTCNYISPIWAKQVNIVSKLEETIALCV